MPGGSWGVREVVVVVVVVVGLVLMGLWGVGVAQMLPN